jgi:hypothetical protein
MVNQGEIKLIDFGLAKAIKPNFIERSLTPNGFGTF